ncbi:TlpA family protein disulfide reductase [Candidatus Aerophobetes bacterium]|nr:TlpA family protein disulfide reductase [Candidatus Aerophobetes bacterium]
MGKLKIKKRLPFFLWLLLFLFFLVAAALPSFSEEQTEKEILLPEKEMREAFESLQVQLISPPVPMIDFKLENTEGELVDTKNLRGKFLWISFWATWCPPCRFEMPSMQKVWEKFGGEKFLILAVNIGEDKKTVVSFLRDNSYTFPTLLDTTQQVSREYGVRAIPTNFFVDPYGKIVGGAIGAREWENPQFYKFLQKLVEENPDK